MDPGTRVSKPPYPMTWPLLRTRNQTLRGGMDDGGTAAADCNALAEHQQDPAHLAAYAEIADTSMAVVEKIFKAFFDGLVNARTAPWTFHTVDPLTYPRPTGKSKPRW
jgi:hypothetical protein